MPMVMAAAGVKAPAGSARVEFLDGIRGWASFAVLLNHLIMNLLARTTPALNVNLNSDIATGHYAQVCFDVLLRLFTDGHLAVLIFFVLSGYALSVSHFDLRKNTLARAAASRYFRLAIPVMCTSLIAYVMLKAGLFYNVQAATLSSQPAKWLGYAYHFDASLRQVLWFASYDAFFRFNWESSYNVALWTMPVELLGSFMIYGFLALFRRTATAPWTIALVAGMALLAAAPLYACFILGYLIAELRQRVSERGRNGLFSLFLLCLFVSSAALSTSSHFRDSDRVVCLIAATLVTTVAFCPPLRRVFCSRISRHLGRISFPLYLIQIPIVCSWSSYLVLRLPAMGFDNVATMTIDLLSTVAIALACATALLPLEDLSVSLARRLGALLVGHSVTRAGTI